jgi:recombination protein RecR
MDSIKKLTELFREFPGIGPRQAKRFVYFLLTRPNSYLNEMAELLKELKKDIRVCSSCFRFFPPDASSSNICSICSNDQRDHTSLMIVSKDVDLETIEKSHSYNGVYFVLGGSVPILEKNPEIKVRSKELLKTVEERSRNNELREIIMAMSINPEGENTEEYIAHLLSPLATQHKIKISILGRGLSTGTELEYSDSETIKNALKNRS